MTDLHAAFGTPINSVSTAASAALSTLPADRPAAEAGVEAMFAAAGLGAPKRIVWCDGPLHISHLREAAARDGTAGPNLAPRLLRLVSPPVMASVDHDPQHAALQASAISHQGLRVAVGRHLADAEARLGARLIARLRSLTSRRHRPLPWNAIDAAGFSQFDAAHFAAASRRGEAVACHLADIVSRCGWMVPHHGIVWLAERPIELNVDDRRRLHYRSGPALAYRDGWAIYAWKGVRISPNLIRNADNITVTQIHRAFDPVIRRCMIDIMTPSRFVANGGAHIVARDDAGILWHRRWRADAWSAVEVVNGSPEPDGSYKHYFLQVPADMRTAREAVAWTYHVSEAQYARLTLRT